MRIRPMLLLPLVKRVRNCEAGSAMVEAALSFPILLAMLLGAVEFGDLAYKATQVTNAARAAAQYAAMNGGGYTDCNGSLTGGTCATTRGMYIAAVGDAPRVVQQCSTFTVLAANTCACSDGTTCTAASATGTTSAYFSCSSSKPVVTSAVTVNASCSPAAAVPGLFPSSLSFNVQGFAQQAVLQ